MYEALTAGVPDAIATINMINAQKQNSRLILYEWASILKTSNHPVSWCPEHHDAPAQPARRAKIPAKTHAMLLLRLTSQAQRKLAILPALRQHRTVDAPSARPH